MESVSKTFRWIAVATVIATYALVVIGGVVRTSGSGLGCPDWPLCQGRVVPDLQGATLIEFSHRVVSSVVTLLILATAFLAWQSYRNAKWIFRPALLAMVLLGVQIVLGGITVLLELPPVVVAVHLGNALLLFAALITAMMFALRPAPSRLSVARDNFPRIVLASTIGTFILILSGTVVTGTMAHYTCATWPLCNDQLIPTGTLPLIAALHRYIAAAMGLVILYTFLQTWRTRRHISALLKASIAAAILFVAQIAVGAVNVEMHFPLATGLLHLATAAASWASMVIYTIVAYQTAAQESVASMSLPSAKATQSLARG